MNVRKMLTFLSLALSLLLVSAPEAPAVSAIINTIPGGDGVFLLNGNAINYLDSMELTVTYDPATMEIVSVQQGEFIGGGSLSSSNAGPGQLRISVHMSGSEPLSGNGRIANITYTPKGGSAGRLISVSGTLINSQGSAMPTIFQPVVNPTQPSKTAQKTEPTDTTKTTDTAESTETTQPTTTQTASPAAVPSAATGLPASISVSMGKGEANSERGESPATAETSQEPVTGAATQREKVAAAEAAAKVEPAGTEAASGVLERFRNYRGERSLQAFAALFKATANAGITQEPWIVLSDGSAKATLLVKGQSSLNYSLQKAKRRALKKAGENSWQLEVVPEKGTYQAALLVKQGSATKTFPLTVAPPANVTDKDLSAYFQERAKGSTRFDLNKDGVVNYIDDYIFTANYLATRQKGAGETGKK